ncbi:metallophosphoesterase family protein [Candidatus Poribacteria bacterium]|nr:metallophosphoesterase family protein [Candidatus Poribacteria bacterium]
MKKQLVFALSLLLLSAIAWAAFEPREEIIPFESEWTYYDYGNPDDITWKLGWKTIKTPVKIKLQDVNRVTSFYFRKQFEIPDPDEITSLLIEIRYTGGVIAYINGMEVLRRNLPENPDYSVFASPSGYPPYMTSMHGDEIQETFTGISPAVLRDGVNQIAVEIHLPKDEKVSELNFALRLAAGKGFHIIKGPYLQNLSRNSVTIMWETDLPSTSEVYYGPGLSVKDDTLKTIHEVTLNDLKSNTFYFYHVLSRVPKDRKLPKDVPPYVLSDVYSFKTAIEPGKSFRFVVYGDSRSNPEVHSKLAEFMKKASPAFLVNTGDLVSSGQYYGYWANQFFAPLEPLISHIPVWTVIGNHERSHVNYFNFFSLPGNEAWYSFDYGDVHFLIIDTEFDYSPGSDQYRFIVDDLSNCKAKWKLVAFHKPPYTAVRRRLPGNMKARKILDPLFEKYGVDMVFCGHDHNYVRSKPINGVVYVITGGGGAGLYEVMPAESLDWAEVAVTTHHLCVLEVKGDTLRLVAVNEDGNVIDKFSLYK